MQISLSRGYFTGSHFTFDSQLSVACTQVSNISNWDCEHKKALSCFSLLPMQESLSAALDVAFQGLWNDFPSLCIALSNLSSLTSLFAMKLTDVMIVICVYMCHMLSCFFFSRRFFICFHGWRMLTVCDALVSCAASRPTCGDDRSPRGRIPSCLAGGEPGRTRANPGEPHRAELGVGFTQKKNHKLHRQSSWFQQVRSNWTLVPTCSNWIFHLAPWSPLIPLHVLTCQEHGMELVAPRSSSEVPGKVPSVTWNL